MMKKPTRHEYILAVGADVKNRFFLSDGKHEQFGPGLGDLSLAENHEKFTGAARQALKKKTLGTIAFDPHPSYFSSRWALANEVGARRLVPVQHHHAHIASVCREHRLQRPVIGVSLDGTGYGSDGNFWGGEFLLVDRSGFRRLAHLKYRKMPGGDKVVREPWRMALSLLGEKAAVLLKKPRREDVRLVLTMLDRDVHAPLTSSAGRLFDAAAALLGICETATHEAEGPIRLESLCRKDQRQDYDFELSEECGITIVDLQPAFEGMLKDRLHGKDPAVMATRFHLTVVNAVLKVVKSLSRRTGISDVVLSGGVFQNKFLMERITGGLARRGPGLFTNERSPVNDLNIALGQYHVSCGSGKN